MNLSHVIAELRRERLVLDKAISAFELMSKVDQACLSPKVPVLVEIGVALKKRNDDARRKMRLVEVVKTPKKA